MTGSASSGAKRKNGRGDLLRSVMFPLGVVVLYIVLLVVTPTTAIRALQMSGRILIQVGLALCMAFVIMFLLNLFVKPAHISRFLGKRAGARGLVLSTVAGILSMGPVYAWYPLLKDLGEQGTSEFHLANFLSNRAVKPVLLPVMVFYFGWAFTLVLNVAIVVGAVVTALVVSSVGKAGRAWQEQA